MSYEGLELVVVHWSAVTCYESPYNSALAVCAETGIKFRPVKVGNDEDPLTQKLGNAPWPSCHLFRSEEKIAENVDAFQTPETLMSWIHG